MAYVALAKYLKFHDLASMRLSFTDIELILKRKLPASARNWRAWWSGDSHPLAKVAIEVGYKATDVNLVSGHVTFFRF